MGEIPWAPTQQEAPSHSAQVCSPDAVPWLCTSDVPLTGMPYSMVQCICEGSCVTWSQLCPSSPLQCLTAVPSLGCLSQEATNDTARYLTGGIWQLLWKQWRGIAVDLRGAITECG